MHDRNDGTLVRVALDLEADKEIEAEERVEPFAQMVMPLVARFWPVEQSI